MITNGMKSSEFVLLVLVLVAGFVLVMTGHLDVNEYWKWAVGGAAAYQVSRGLAKQEPVTPPNDKA